MNILLLLVGSILCTICNGFPIDLVGLGLVQSYTPSIYAIAKLEPLKTPKLQMRAFGVVEDTCTTKINQCMKELDLSAYQTALETTDVNDICAVSNLFKDYGVNNFIACIALDDVFESCKADVSYGQMLSGFKNFSTAGVSCPSNCASSCQSFLATVKTAAAVANELGGGTGGGGTGGGGIGGSGYGEVCAQKMNACFALIDQTGVGNVDPDISMCQQLELLKTMKLLDVYECVSSAETVNACQNDTVYQQNVKDAVTEAKQLSCTGMTCSTLCNEFKAAIEKWSNVLPGGGGNGGGGNGGGGTGGGGTGGQSGVFFDINWFSGDCKKEMVQCTSKVDLDSFHIELKNAANFCESMDVVKKFKLDKLFSCVASQDIYQVCKADAKYMDYVEEAKKSEVQCGDETCKENCDLYLELTEIVANAGKSTPSPTVYVPGTSGASGKNAATTVVVATYVALLFL